MKKFAAALLAIVCLAAATPTTSADSGKLKAIYRDPFDGITYDDCTGEEISLLGETHIVVTERPQQDGTYRYDAIAHTWGKGVGLTTGNEYTFSFYQKVRYDMGTTFCDPEGINRAPYEQKQTYRLPMISKGSLPNSYYDFTVVWRFDENCNFSEEIIESASGCRGGGNVGVSVR